MKVYKFPKGGILYEDSSAPSAAAGTNLAFLPRISVVALKQHSGSAAAPVVRTGDSVREGQLLARSQNAGEANVHSPMPGEIMRVHSWNISGDNPAYNFDNKPAVQNEGFVIKFNGSFEILGKKEKRRKWHELKPFELRRQIVEAGIVEMSGAGVPFETLFAETMKKNAERTLVVRCVFDDPWLAADVVLCRQRTDAIAEGAFITAQAAEAGHIIFAVSANHYELGKALFAAAQKNAETTLEKNIEPVLVTVGSRYPQRADREMEYAVRSFEKTSIKPFGALLMAVPASMAAVYDAVVLHKPLVSRCVAVGGSAVKKPSIIEAKIGVRIGELFEQCGGFKKEPYRIGIGSKILGREAASLDEPVTKVTFAVFADSASFFHFPFMKRNKTLKKTKAKKYTDLNFNNSCINCGLCRNVCPANLDPESLFRRISSERFSERFSYLAAECNSCACCELVCPSRLPLCTVIKRYSSGAGR